MNVSTWTCPRCRATGSVDVRADASEAEILAFIRTAHGTKQPRCEGTPGARTTNHAPQTMAELYRLRGDRIDQLRITKNLNARLNELIASRASLDEQASIRRERNKHIRVIKMLNVQIARAEGLLTAPKEFAPSTEE